MKIKFKVISLYNSYMEFIRFENNKFIKDLDDFIQEYKLDYDLVLMAFDYSIIMYGTFYTFKYDIKDNKILCLTDSGAQIIDNCYIGITTSAYRIYLACMTRRRKQVIEDLFSFIDLERGM